MRWEQWRRKKFESGGGHQYGANVGPPIQREAPENMFFGRVSPLFGSKSTISRFDERFSDGQYSLVSFLFAVLLLTVLPPCPAICKSGGGARAPRSLWSRRHWMRQNHTL